MLVASSGIWHNLGDFHGCASPRRFRGCSSPCRYRDKPSHVNSTDLCQVRASSPVNVHVPVRAASPRAASPVRAVSPVSPNTARGSLRMKLVKGSPSPRSSERNSRRNKPGGKMSTKVSMSVPYVHSITVPAASSVPTMLAVYGLPGVEKGIWKFAPHGCLTSARACRILCYGDSLTAGFCQDGLQYEPYGETLSEVLSEGGAACEVGVCGLVGHRAEAMITELNHAHVQDITGRPGKGLVRILEEDQPIDLVILMVGTNDLGRGSHPQDIADDICTLHAACHTRGVPTISIAPPTGISMQRGWARSNRDQLADILATRLGARAGADDGVLAHFDAEELLPRIPGNKHWEPDEIHLSAAGSVLLGKLLATWILPAVLDAFGPNNCCSSIDGSRSGRLGIQQSSTPTEDRTARVSSDDASQVGRALQSAGSSPPSLWHGPLRPNSLNPIGPDRSESPHTLHPQVEGPQTSQPFMSSSQSGFLFDSIRSPSPSSRAETAAGRGGFDTEEKMQAVLRNIFSLVEASQTEKRLRSKSPPSFLRSSIRSPSPSGRNATPGNKWERQQTPPTPEEKAHVLNCSLEVPPNCQPLQSPAAFLRSSIQSPISTSRASNTVSRAHVQSQKSPRSTEDRIKTVLSGSSVEVRQGQKSPRNTEDRSKTVLTGSSVELRQRQKSPKNIEDRPKTVLSGSSVEVPLISDKLRSSGSCGVLLSHVEAPLAGQPLRSTSPRLSHRSSACNLDLNQVVEVWSKTAGVWCKGLIKKLDGNNICVEYTLPDGRMSRKDLPLDNPELKLLSPAASATSPSKVFAGLLGVMSPRSPRSPTRDRHLALD